MSDILSLNCNNSSLQPLTNIECSEINGGGWIATAWGVAKASALFGGSAVIVTGAVVGAGYIVYKIVS